MIKALLSFSLIIFLNVVFGYSLIKIMSHIENNPYSSQKPLLYCIWTSIICHFFLIYLAIPLKFILLSCAVQSLFVWLYKDYPSIKYKDFRFIIGILMTLINHFLLTGIFMNYNSYSIFSIIPSYLIIWIPALIIMFSIGSTSEIMFNESSNKSRLFELRTAL